MQLKRSSLVSASSGSLALITALLIGVSALPAGAQSLRVYGEPVVSSANKATQSAPQWVAPFATNAPQIAFSAVGADRIESAKLWNVSGEFKATQVGVVQRASEEWVSGAIGEWTQVGTGRVNQFKVQTPGAFTMRVLLRFESLDPRAELRVAGASGAIVVTSATDIFRSLNEDGNYWTAITEGDVQSIEVYLPVTAAGLPTMRVEAAIHDFASIKDNFKSATQLKGNSGACNVDAICPAQTPGYVNARSAVAHMQFTANCGAGGALASCICTGTLLNDTDSATQIPYFYSANHCISTQSQASTLTTYWGYQNATCGGADMLRSQSTALTGGADLLYASQNMDALLMRLRSTPPVGAFFAGWDIAAITGSTPVTIIHHPAGDPKKVTIGQTPANPFTILSDMGSTSYVTAAYSSGVTEGGSSGSGIFSQASGSYFLRGGLLGGPSSCATAGDINNPSNRDYYSRFDMAYAFMKNWLAPTPTTPVSAARTGIDIDGDGRNEIVLRSANGTMSIGRFANNTLTFTNNSDPGASFRIVGAGDFDGNGRSDLAFLNIAQGDRGDVRYWPGFTSAGEVLWRQVRTVWNVQAVGDMDGDGVSDLVWRFQGFDPARPGDTGVSYIWFTNQGGPPTVRKRGGAPLSWQLLGAADLNTDGAADMLYLSPDNQLRALMATPSRTCANLSAGVVPAVFTVLRYADFTGNGRGDVLLRNSAGAVQLISLNGVGLTLPPYTGAPDDPDANCTPSGLNVAATFYGLPNVDSTWSFYASGDLNGDGINDIVWRQPSGVLTVWLLASNGGAPTIIQNSGTAPANLTPFLNGGPPN
ncbi:MAG: FG-GAP repeat domain-containing protein [Burkholderiales bacterium]